MIQDEKKKALTRALNRILELYAEGDLSDNLGMIHSLLNELWEEADVAGFKEGYSEGIKEASVAAHIRNN